MPLPVNGDAGIVLFVASVWVILQAAFVRVPDPAVVPQYSALVTLIWNVVELPSQTLFDVGTTATFGVGSTRQLTEDVPVTLPAHEFEVLVILFKVY